MAPVSIEEMRLHGTVRSPTQELVFVRVDRKLTRALFRHSAFSFQQTQRCLATRCFQSCWSLLSVNVRDSYWRRAVQQTALQSCVSSNSAPRRVARATPRLRARTTHRMPYGSTPLDLGNQDEIRSSHFFVGSTPTPDTA